MCTHYLKRSYLQPLNRTYGSGSVVVTRVLHVSYVAEIDSPIFNSVIIKMSLSPFTGSSAMNKLRQSFRRKKDIYVPESSRPHQWQTDEEAVRSGKCNFAVKVTPSHTNTHEYKTLQMLFTDTHSPQNALLTSLWHTHTSEKPALQGRCLWLIISFYLGCKSMCWSLLNMWDVCAQLISGLQEFWKSFESSSVQRINNIFLLKLTSNNDSAMQCLYIQHIFSVS